MLSTSNQDLHKNGQRLMKIRYHLLFLPILLAFLPSCVTTKKSKQETGWLKTKIHDLNAHYNGYWNANELYKASVDRLELSHQDNYNQILEIYPYGTEEDRKLVEEDMDKAIEKVVKVASLHEPSKWVDDCYVMMGKAQFLKGDYESAQETLEYFVEDFNPKDPNSRVYQSPNRKESAKQKKKEQAEERKIQKEEREKVQEEKAKSRKQQAKERKKARKQAEKERKKRNIDRKKGIKTPVKKPVVVAEEEEKDAIPTGVSSTSNDIPLDPDEAYIQQLEEEERSKKNKKTDTEQKDGFLKHKPAYYEGMFWLARTFVARGRWIEANYFLDKLEKDEGVLKKIENEVPVVRADYFLQQKDYRNAIPALEKALEINNDRTLKARMAYILAQAYQMNGESSKAFEAFESVKKYKTDFEMELHAELNQLKNEWASGSSSSDKVNRRLERMAREDKNRNYKGSIYATIAEIKLADGDREGAMEYFKMALGASNSNGVKTEIYYRLGTLFFANENFLQAKLYYDSTLVVMDEKDPRFSITKSYATSLKNIAKNISIINEQDSLLRLGEMSEKELDEFARKKAELAWEEDQKNKEVEEGGFQATTSVFSGESKFFAYNQTIKQRGHQDFLKRWGDRPLEDNWRRSNKSSSVFDQEDLSQPEQLNEIPEAELRKEIDKIVRTIPRDQEAKKAANEKIEQAMFELGTGFRTNLENFARSNETLLRLVDRYPGTTHKPEAMYFIHLNYIDLGKSDMAESFKTRLIREFPESPFAIYLKNPNNNTALLTKEREIEMYYESAYELFEKGAYEQTFKRMEEAQKQFGENHYMKPKYDLLYALCIGNLKGQDEYINALRGVILRHDNTPEQTYAREMLRFLRGDSESFGGEATDEELSRYIEDFDKLHYFIVVVHDGNSDMIKEMKSSIEAYNTDKYANKRLRITNLSLNKTENTYILLLRRYTDKEDAMTYYKDVKANLDNFADTKKFSYDVYAINQKNYRTVMQDNAIGAYRVYFDKKYLGI